LDALRESEAAEKTGLFDTHPADRHRIARARDEATEGIFHLDGEATDLFRSFDSLARACTFEYYRALIGPDLSKDQLYPVAEAIETQAVAHRGGEALDRFFLRGFHPLQLLPLPAAYPAAPGDLKAAKQALVKVRGEMERAHRNTAAAWK